MKTAVLVSGGVDSSVALALLAQEKRDLTAFYLKIWLEDEMSTLGECPWEEDLKYVREVCGRFGVPLEVIPMQREYWDRVVDYTLREARAGRTPNPDILCNQEIKFGQFYDRIDPAFMRVATGHYARVQREADVTRLLRAPDPIKDQTYFLSRLTQRQLSRAEFPIGHLFKKDVRALAADFNLPNQARKDSQGICFLGKFKYRDFIKHHLGTRPGDFVDAATGRRVGEHDGYWFYTIGQRNGLGLSGGPWFVVKKDVEANRVFLAQGYSPVEVMRDAFEVQGLHWLSGVPEKTDPLEVRIRHGAALHSGRLEFSENKGRVFLEAPVQGVAPGQFAVFYQGEVCLGSGVIV